MSLPWSSKGTKATPVNADEIMILDSADANPATQNKRITVGSLASVGGEANTASNVGVGLGWFKQKTGVDLEYKSLIANSPIAAVSNVDDITLNLDALLNADISAIANIQYSKLENVSDTNILVGDATNKAAPVILSGDATIANTGVLTIANDAIDDNKIASHTSTKITINSKPQLNSNIVYTDQTQTYGAFAQIFPNTQLQLLNPAGSFQYLFATNAITANRTVSLPLLDGNDTFAFVSAIQTLANKTLSVPTIADFTNANHDHSGPTQGGNLTNSALSVGVFGSITGLGVQTQPLDMGSNLINSVTTPVSDNDAANKLYVDEIVSGLAWKDPAQVATTGNITLSGEQTIDGILTSSDRVLVKDQTSAEENGVYLSDAGAWTRTTDADTEDELLNMTISIKQGTVNENTIWLLITDEPIVVDTTELNYIEIIGGSASPLTTKGDLFGYDTGNARIPVGSNGQVLTANSAVALGVEWSSTGGGDMILAAVQTVTGAKTFEDSTLLLRNVADTFNGSFVNTNTADRIYTLPDAAGVIVLDTFAQTLTNKTLTLPIISSISNTGTLTLPTTTDTLVGRATTDTLTNKTLTSPIISTIENTGTLTLPTGPDTLVGRVSFDTLTNKTIDADGTGNVITNIGSSEIKSEIITGQTLKATPVAADEFLISDSADSGNTKRATLTSLLGGGGSQTPWTSDIDGDGFDLKDLSNVEFRETTGTPLGSVPAMYHNASGIKINVPTGDSLQVLVNGNPEYTFDATEADFNGNNLASLLNLEFVTAGTGSATTTNFINALGGGVNFNSDSNGRPFIFQQNGVIEFQVSANTIDLRGNTLQFADANTTIQQSGTNLQIDVATGGTIGQRINNIIIADVSATGIDLPESGDKFSEQGTNISPIGKQDIWIPASAMWPSTTSGAAGLTQRELPTNDVDIQTFDFISTTVDEYTQFTWTPPRNWDESTITVKFYWTSTSGSAGNVVWGLQGRASSNNDLLDSAWGSLVTVTDAWIANNDLHISNETTSIAIGGTPSAEDMVQFRVVRNGANGSDTFADNAELLGIRIEYTLDAAVSV